MIEQSIHKVAEATDQMCSDAKLLAADILKVFEQSHPNIGTIIQALGIVRDRLQFVTYRTEEVFDVSDFEELDRRAFEVISKVNWRLTPKISSARLSLHSALSVWCQCFLKYLASPAKLQRAKRFLIELTAWLKER